MKSKKPLLLFALLLASTLSHAAEPAGTPLLPGKPDSLTYYGGGDVASIIKVVPVTGQPFSQALQVDTFARAGAKSEAGLSARITAPVKKGDVLWLSFKARRLKSTRESGEAFFQVRVDQLVNNKYQWPPYLERGISVGPDWTDVSVPFPMTKDITAENSRVIVMFDPYPQQFEIGPITLLDCGPGVRLEDLPRSVVRYEGDAPDAPWRKAALERIEKNRKGDLAIKVVDADGKPVADAEVAVHMQRLAFNFGTATNSSLILDQTDPAAKIYRETLLKCFNQVVFENEMKWGKWADPKTDHSATLQACDWFKAHDITVRGHVMLWPSWQHLPKALMTLKDDPAALRAAISAHIQEQTSFMKGRFVQWDVTNELYKHHDLLDILGRDELVKWYAEAHAAAPDVKLFYNEYTMFHEDGPGTGNEHFYNDLKFLKEKGAPIDGIGEQAHIGGTPPAIPLVLARLDKFSTFGLPITITEFDLTSDDQDFQANYLRDFATAIFSHPNTIGLVQWGFWEGSHWLPSSALWNKDWTIRKHGQVFLDLVTKTWRTDAEGRSNNEGAYQTRAFYGDYAVSVTRGEKTQTTKVKFAPGGDAVTTITLAKAP